MKCACCVTMARKAAEDGDSDRKVVGIDGGG
jgi:hypothetical protein